ncbi:hypothetical protein GQ53DRAFT_102089 [Thozetella sp. PMI_491]|nr:hypothetical protein GQ53DRAFT_102089 [Thozetella sp. PMI_491]
MVVVSWINADAANEHSCSERPPLSNGRAQTQNPRDTFGRRAEIFIDNTPNRAKPPRGRGETKKGEAKEGGGRMRGRGKTRIPVDTRASIADDRARGRKSALTATFLLRQESQAERSPVAPLLPFCGAWPDLARPAESVLSPTSLSRASLAGRSCRYFLSDCIVGVVFCLSYSRSWVLRYGLSG